MSLAKRLISGSIQLTLSSIVVRVLSIVAMPILTQLLAPAAYGEAALLGSLISLLTGIALFGLDMSYARAYLSATEPSGAAVEHFVWRCAIGLGILGGLLGASLWYWVLADWLKLSRPFAVLLGVGVALCVCCTMAQVRARLNNSYRRLSIAIALGGLASVAASIGIAAWWRTDALPLLVAILVTSAVPLLLLGTPGLRQLVCRSKLGSQQKSGLIGIGLAGVVTAPMYWVLSSSDRWFIGHFHGSDAVGVYSIGFNVAAVGLMVNVAIMSVWLPEASREYERDRDLARVQLGRLMSRLVVALGVVWLAVTAAGSDLVRWLANERFHGAADYVPFIAAGVFFYGVMHLANVGLLLVKQLKWAIVWWLVGAVICLGGNLLLVPPYGGLGAAVTQLTSFGFMAMGILATSQRIYRMDIDWRGVGMALLLILVIGAGMCRSWNEDPIVSLLMKVPVGVISVGLIAWIGASDWLFRGLDVVRGRHRQL